MSLGRAVRQESPSVGATVTSHIAHGAYLSIRDEVTDRGISLGLTTATNPARILDVASSRPVGRSNSVTRY